MKHLKKLTTLLLSLFAGVLLQAQDPLLQILKEELNYQFTEMQKLSQKPYFMDFRVIDRTSHSVSTEFGAVTDNSSHRVRNFVPSIRVGSMELDNQMDPRQTSTSLVGLATVSLPLNDEPRAIKQVIWDEVFVKYKRAVDDLERVISDRRLRVEQDDKAPAFS